MNVAAEESLVVVTSPVFAHHLPPPGHPEQPDRAIAMEGAALAWQQRGGRLVAPRRATRSELARVHDDAYLDRLEATRGTPTSLDADTFTSRESLDVAALAAGATLTALEHAMRGRGPAVALVRPPGHHAERDRAMGFCLYNNVAVAAAAALESGLERVAIVDFDVHHGNGTQWIFYEDPRVLYVSTHQYPYYPGTGAADEVGRHGGHGFTVNVPLAGGATDADYDLVFEAIVDPVLRAFAPELILVSAGFDIHAHDPLGGMRLSTLGCASLVTRLWHVATEVCSRRLVAVTEGGYDLHALRACLDATLDILSGAPPARPVLQGDTARGRAALARVRPILSPFWPTL